MFKLSHSALAGLFLSVSASAVGSQVQSTEPETFTSENAILDTSLLFAIGAREARQELRGAFGWPTFQEGLVDGAYFRFDPDGYARFSPNPRLDTDVFEVICRPRTYSCMGRKGTLSYMLNQSGQLQIRLENAAEGDRFFVADGISELEVPSRILQPLDDRMETLLSSSDELIIRRGENEIDRLSLVGFGAVSAYLRWISARQDYTVLPRGWPIPNGAPGVAESNLTQAANWDSPMPQPQAPVDFESAAAGNEMAEVRGELNVLRELLLERSAVPNAAAPAMDSSAIAPALPSAEANRIAELERNAAALKAELDMLRGSAPAVPAYDMASPALPTAPTMPQVPTAAANTMYPSESQSGMGHMTEMPTTDPTSLAHRLEYLMTEIGLDAKTALMIIEMGSEAELDESQPATPETIAKTYQNQLISDILSELQKTTTESEADMMEPTEMVEVPQTPAPIAPKDYVLLTDYFKSVFKHTQITQ